MQNLERAIEPRGPAPVSDWDPPFCGDMNIFIRRDGSWLHEGTLIRRKNLVQLFSTIMKLENDGQYYLVSPIEKLRIQVEDCPFVVNQMNIKTKEDNQIVVMTTNVGEVVEISKERPIKMGKSELGAPHPVVHIRDGLVALVNRAVFYRLMELAESFSGEIGIWSSGDFVSFEQSE
ncbi:MAG: DUF1285 domain-containing protein [Gammaproteobacteria bacterium]|nr:DUF1285 domain-containing protein [Gammaproteobacteria bacterium]